VAEQQVEGLEPVEHHWQQVVLLVAALAVALLGEVVEELGDTLEVVDTPLEVVVSLGEELGEELEPVEHHWQHVVLVAALEDPQRKKIQ